MKLSATLQALFDKGLLDRLPLTFTTFFFDRIQEWNLLFPAEQHYFEQFFALIDRSNTATVDKLFAPLREVEKKMGVSEKVWPKRQFTLGQVDFLNRSAHFPEWRQTIAQIFSELDPLLDAEVARSGHARLVVVISPADLPVGPDQMWERFREHGKMLSLDLSAVEDASDYLAQLLTGGKRAERRKTIAQLYASTSARSAYDTWLIEAGDSLPRLAEKDSPPLVALSYERLHPYRTRLMSEVNKILETENIRGPRQLGEKLKQLKMNAAEEQGTRDPVISEFIRATLLNGNGTLLINNTFVEWVTIQATRRARPTVAVVSFGIRNKIKPFSSLLIFSDQDRVTPIPTQADAFGSYVDLEVFDHYLWLEFEKYAEYRRNTVYLFVAERTDKMLVIAPPDFLSNIGTHSARLTDVFSWTKEWLNL